MSKRFITALLVLLTLGVQAFAQSAVSGKVTDQSGEPLVGVNVLVKGTTNGTMTDYNGNYNLSNVRQDAVLVFSSIGFAAQEVTVGSQRTINVQLKEDAAFLDEVVVVGYGTARKKDVSGAIASVNYGNDDNLVSLPNPNALAGLSSKVAGFSYAPTSSAGGDNTSTMTIRGMNVIPSGGSKSASAQSLNKPLIIVDGVIFGGSINEINTSDIATVDVLKDASAAAIYGSRAANGVLIITTKTGSSEKPTVRFNASVSLSDWTRTPKYVTDETTFFRNRFYAKAAGDASIRDLNWETYDKNTLFVSDIERQAYSAGKNVNWIDEISRTGVGQKYDVSVSGKNKSTSYYVSSDYTRQQGIRLGDDYEKFTFMAKLDWDLTSWLKAGVKANYLGSDSWGTPARIQNATWMSPYSYIMNETVPGYTDWYASKPDGNTISPLWGTGSGDSYLWTTSKSNSNNMNGVAYAQIDFPFLKGLSYRITAQGRRGFGSSDSFSSAEIWIDTQNTAQMDDPNSYYGTNAGGSSSSSNSAYWNIDNILTYTTDFGLHHVDLMLGYTRERSKSNSLGTTYTGFSSTDFIWYAQDEAANQSINRGASETSAIAYLGRINYNFANKYYLTANVRRDGYSVFADGHKWGNFYGASAAWVLSNENFIKDNLSWVDFLKLRLSYGENGSRTIGAYATTSSVVSTQSNSGTRTYAWLGGQSAFGVKVNQLPNYTLTWAKVTKGDLGLDFSFAGSRINGSIDAYIGETSNMLVARSAPYITGFDSVNANVGRVTNNGLEVVLNTVNINGDGFNNLRWESNLVFDTNSNKLKKLYDGTTSDVASYLVTPESNYALVEGYSIGAVYDLKMLGIFQNQAEIDAHGAQSDAVVGDVKFEDHGGKLDADGNPMPDGKINDDDRYVIGTMDPLFTVNFGNTFSWKGFSLYFNFRWMQGDKTHFLGLNPNYYTAGQGSGAQLAGVDKWVDEQYYQNLTNEFPRHGYNNETYKYQWWNNRSFLKLKDLSFSYTLPQNIVKPVGLSNVRLYVAGTDLFTITKWTGLDPETGGTIAANASSSRYGANGTYKTVTFGVNLTF